MSKKLFEQIVLRTALTTITQNQYLLSAFATISNIQNVLYISKKDKQKKMYCIVCEEKFNNALLFILHLQLQHKRGPNTKIIVQKYVVSQNILKVYQHNKNQMDVEINDFLLPIGKAGQGDSTYLFKSQANRAKAILSQIAIKIVQQKIPQKKSQLQFYYHSSNIFNKTKFQGQCEDSEQEISTVERQLYEKEINQFKDVNECDKKFFIEWNSFVESYRAKGCVIYPQNLENLLSDFASQLALLSETNMRLNLVMHLWTLWSLGQINSQIITNMLEKYDKERNKLKGKTV